MLEQVTLQFLKAESLEITCKLRIKIAGNVSGTRMKDQLTWGCYFPIVSSHRRSQMGQAASTEVNRTTSKLVYYLSTDSRV